MGPGLQRICSRTHCHFPLPTIYRWKQCPSCRERSRDYQRRRLLNPASKRAPLKHKALTTEHRPLTTPQISLAHVPADTIVGHPIQNFSWAHQLFQFTHQLETTSLCPPYQCHDDLLDDLCTRLHSFIHTQAHRSHMGFPSLQLKFDFAGEYSVVAADDKIASRTAAVDVRVDDIEARVARVAGLAFGARSSYVRPYASAVPRCYPAVLQHMHLLSRPRICSASWRYSFSRMSPTGIFLERRPLSVFCFSGEGVGMDKMVHKHSKSLTVCCTILFGEHTYIRRR
ncbi:hypothetical protein B0H10DRAFT_2070928 [Mycena sp. CBHHK59/15]|nr:hypothetical protein B0H10DRAFT_2070928 [Mycena sp. CBHHK59/15]